MIFWVVGINIAIALFGFFLAWRLWHLKRTLTSTTVAIDTWERQSREILAPGSIPAQIRQGQQTTAATRTQYRQLQVRLQQLRRLLSVGLMVVQFTQGSLKRQRR